MMLHFINLLEAASTDNYEKGKLFEKRVKKIVDECGYTDIKLREDYLQKIMLNCWRKTQRSDI